MADSAAFDFVCGKLEELSTLPDHSVRARLQNYALDHGVELLT